MIKKVIIIGPAHPLRGGGITTFNQRLCRAFLEKGYDCRIFSFSLQYPSILFPGKSQYTREPAPEGLQIYSIINSIHPFNWWHVGRLLKNMRPDLVIVRFWIPFMGPALGTILRKVQQNRHTRIVAIADNIIPHEKRPGDKAFTRYFINSCDAFITMGDQVLNDFKQFNTSKPITKVLHPLYDNFGPPISRETARKKLQLPEQRQVLLFFGFVRKYKGLDLLLEALHLLKKEMSSSAPPPLLLVAGEFYDDEKPYRQLVEKWGLQDWVRIENRFIPDSEVAAFLCAADVVVQPYRHATQSGVTPLAYHFEKPMIVTRVGSLPEQVPHGRAGLVADPEPRALANSIKEYFSLGEAHFLPQLRSEKSNYSWPALVDSIISVAESIKKDE